jgi:FdhD protein
MQTSVTHTENAAAGRARVQDRSGVTCDVVRFRKGQLRKFEDNLAAEEPLEIRLCHGRAEARQTKSLSVTMRTPGDDCELAVGFLVTEAVIRDSSDIMTIDSIAIQPSGRSATCPTVGPVRYGRGSAYNTLQVELHPDVVVNTSTLDRNFYTTSSCGICGKASLLALRTVCPVRTPDSFSIATSLLCELPARARERQSLFELSGGLHAAALFDSCGRLQSIREDVGRHNAVDKLVGAECVADRMPLRDRLLFLSGRVSFELLQKAVMAGIPMVVAIGAPSSLAVQVAKLFDITLVGFVRDCQFNIYNRPERLRFTEQTRRQ